MHLFFYAVAFLIVLLTAHQILRRNQAIAWVVFLICPFLLPLLLAEKDFSYFLWMKMYSVCLGTSWLLACRYTAWAQNKTALWILWGIFALNILEAIVEGALDRTILSYVNCISGVLLLFTLPSVKEIRVDTHHSTRDLLWDIPMKWVIGYSIWNWTFIYTTWPEFGLRHLVILLASLLISVRNTQLWIQSRAFILGVYLLIHFSYDSSLKHLDISTNYYAPLAMTTTILGAIWMISYFIQTRFSPSFKIIAIK